MYRQSSSNGSRLFVQHILAGNSITGWYGCLETLNCFIFRHLARVYRNKVSQKMSRNKLQKTSLRMTSNHSNNHVLHLHFEARTRTRASSRNIVVLYYLRYLECMTSKLSDAPCKVNPCITTSMIDKTDHVKRFSVVPTKMISGCWQEQGNLNPSFGFRTSASYSDKISVRSPRKLIIFIT